MANRIIYLARFKVETATPLGVGSGETGLVNDRLVAKDANGLPYIPGTSLAGVIRHEMEERSEYKAEITRLFGYQYENEGQGSRLAFSPGVLVAADNETVLEGLQRIDPNETYYTFFRRLPERDHVRINDRGTAARTGKFEEELVHRGTRFVFEIELDGSSDDEAGWELLLDILHHPTFRIGAGTRKGFGQLKILECTQRIYDLQQKEELKAYLEQDTGLDKPIMGGSEYQAAQPTMAGWLKYDLELEAKDFYLFGSGLFQEEVHNTPKTESYFKWDTGKPVLSKPQLLIPATSVKGALAHRLAYHYNQAKDLTIEEPGKKQGTAMPQFDRAAALAKYHLGLPIEELNFAEMDPEWKRLEEQIDQLSLEDSVEWKEYLEQLDSWGKRDSGPELPVGEDNPAVRALFGYAKDSAEESEQGARGKAVFSDIYLEKEEEQLKVLNHVAIDRFTGGAIDGALFQEQVVAGSKFTMQIFIEEDAFDDAAVRTAFERTLDDLVEGRLALGGNTTKGHGIFQGKWEVDLEKSDTASN